MSTKKTDAIETTAAKTEELAGLPAYMKVGDTRGTDHITKDDMQIPRLKIAQGLSPQMLKSDPAYIEGLRLGDAFNDLTGEVYGDGPMEVLFVRADAPRHVLFDPDDRKKIVEFSLPATDPRTQWTVDEEGKRQKPEATLFYDYVILLGPGREPMAVSFSSTGINTAKKINGLIRLIDPRIGSPVPIFAKRYELKPVEMKNDQGTWFLFSARQLGLVDEETYHVGEQAFDTFADKRVDFDRGDTEVAPETATDTGEM